MKTAVLLSLLYLAAAFEAPSPVKRTTTPTTQLAMAQKSKKMNPIENILKGLSNNFKPFHGHGSLEDDLEDEWEAQQEILRNRRSDHVDKAHLKQKYANPNDVKFDGKVGDSKKSSFGKNLFP